MQDYTEYLPEMVERCVGEHDLVLQVFRAEAEGGPVAGRPPLLLVHGAFSGSWMWARYIPHFVSSGWDVYALNLRGHYKSRSVDLSAVCFADYLDDIRAILAEIDAEHALAPIVVGFSMGGLLALKLAEDLRFSGLVLIDASICRQVHDRVPYRNVVPHKSGLIVPAPVREERCSIDETAEDIAFQRKYLSMESAKAFREFSFHFGTTGISVESDRIACPSLVVCAISEEADDTRGQVTAGHVGGDYLGLWHTTHTGLLVGQRYQEVVERMLSWLAPFSA